MQGDVHPSILIAATEIKSHLTTGRTLKENASIAMAVAKTHWLVTNREDQFKSAIAGLAMFYKDKPEEDLLTREVQALAKFNTGIKAARQGIAVDIATMLPTPEESKDFIGLYKIWETTLKDM